MRTYISLNVINACNKNCSYCINRPYINNPNYPTLLEFEKLKPWLIEHIQSNDIVEIAGTGEPTLCKWLPKLFALLETLGCHVFVRTNGFDLKYRIAYPTIHYILSQHDMTHTSAKKLAAAYLLPNDLVLRNVVVQSNNIAPDLVDDCLRISKTHDITKSYFITPDYHIRHMPCCRVAHDSIDEPSTKKHRFGCHTWGECPFLLGAYNFIEYFKSPFKLDDTCAYRRVCDL